MNKKIVRVTIGVPNKGVTDPAGLDNYMEMMVRIGKLQAASEMGVHDIKHADGETHYEYPEDVEFKFALTTVPRIFPALARERIAEQAFEAKQDYLFMFDDDMIMMPDIFERLYKNQKDIVAALAFARLEPYHPVLYNLVEGFDPVANKEYYVNMPVLTYPKDTLVECDAVGFGAVLIDMNVLKKLEKPWFMTTSGAGEDIHFCHKAHKAGFRIFSDTATKIGHLSERPVITEEVYESNPENMILREKIGDENKYGEKK